MKRGNCAGLAIQYQATLFCLSLMCSVLRLTPAVAQPQLFNNAKNPVKLGSFVEFDLAVKDVQVTQAFYESLGFKAVAAAKADHPVAAVTDGNVVLALHQAEFASPTITYYGANLAAGMSLLQETGVAATILKKKNGAATEIEFSDRNGQRVVLKSEAPVPRPDVGFEMMTPAGPTGKEKHYSRIGIFGEFSIAVKERATAAAFWQKLGFQKMHESDIPYPWGIYSDSVTVLGLHQTTEFKETALSFFSRDSKDRIVKLKEEGFTFVLEMDPTNAVMQSPDGQMIFVFNLP
ncbi:hypothetical protein FBQ85_16495 [Cytophagia bacterium CHB2]|nr:hypothetical protein [Cytophagia bacterium CHB2]